ncbi:hypothetical protein TSAR_012677 [Trichomalopsis sarcophagae]|uniref:Uncharacterized protein n=1 Tax=Trichomalopsis sarcophagae TaxID=543379 RepID=A0A232FCF0_9HYME|nr:hypothetical protein TSAR_012677 [Trichomalopsis sarcophagae]
MPLNNDYFSMNFSSRGNSVTRHFFSIGTWFCIILNMYNWKISSPVACPNIFSPFLESRIVYFSRRIPHMRF